MVRRKKVNSQQNQLAALVAGLQRLVVAVPQPAAPRKKRRRGKKNNNNLRGGPTDGSIVIQRSELLASIQLPANTTSSQGVVSIKPANFSFLKGIGDKFEQVRWEKLSFYYKPAVGTTYGGMFSMGLDWLNTSAKKTRTEIAAYTPSMSCAAWSDTQPRPMVAPPSRLHSRAWLLPNSSSADSVDSAPCSLKWAVDGTSSKDTMTLGEVWATYRVAMQGTAA